MPRAGARKGVSSDFPRSDRYPGPLGAGTLMLRWCHSGLEYGSEEPWRRELRRTMATMDNLKEAFAGESQANRKYLAFAKKAEQDGLAQVAKLFRAAAEAETVHAHAHLRALGRRQEHGREPRSRGRRRSVRVPADVSQVPGRGPARRQEGRGDLLPVCARRGRGSITGSTPERSRPSRRARTCRPRPSTCARSAGTPSKATCPIAALSATSRASASSKSPEGDLARQAPEAGSASFSAMGSISRYPLR